MQELLQNEVNRQANFKCESLVVFIEG